MQSLVLDNADGLDAGAQGSELCNLAQRVHADLFDFKCHCISSVSHSFCCGHIVPGAHDRFVDHEAGWAPELRIHDAYAITHGARGHGGHAAELASAENANQAARLNDRWFLDQGRSSRHYGSSCVITSSVRAARQAANRS